MSGPMTPEESARRMTALLANPPRSTTSKKYLASLSKREKIVVQPEDYTSAHAQALHQAQQIATRRMAEKLKAVATQTIGNGVRLRPRARVRAWELCEGRWQCRDSGFRKRQTHGVGGQRPWWPQDKVESEARREILILAQGGFCALCGKPLDKDNREHPAERPSIDHVIPRDMGGVNRWNLVAAHNQCNSDKHNDLPTGCEVIWLLVVNAQMRRLPAEMQEAFYR